MICVLGFTFPFNNNLPSLTGWHWPHSTLSTLLSKTRWTRVWKKTLALRKCVSLDQCSVGKRCRVWRRTPMSLPTSVVLLWCPWTVRGLQQWSPLKQEKLPHGGPLEGPDADPVESSLALDENYCIWLTKPSKVKKYLRFICIFYLHFQLIFLHFYLHF